MPKVNKIAGYENSYINQNKISFKSKFVPNEALRDAFYCAHADLMWTSDWRSEHARSFVKIIEHLLNDGKDDLIKLSRSKTASSVVINGKRVNFYRESPSTPGTIDGGRVLNNVVDYFSKKGIGNTSKLTYDELKVIKPEIDNLNSELNADDVTKNPGIFFNLENNVHTINAILRKHADELLDKLETTIFYR